MVDEEIKQYLSDENDKLNFKGLLKVLENRDVIVKNKKLCGVAGMTTFDCIYIDLECLDYGYPSTVKFFVFLHELGHYKRIEKYGKEFFINKLSSDNPRELFEYLILEEDVANRYAKLLYRKINKESFPEHLFNQINSTNRKATYMEYAKELVGKVQNNEDNYNKLMESYIYDI